MRRQSKLDSAAGDAEIRVVLRVGGAGSGGAPVALPGGGDAATPMALLVVVLLEKGNLLVIRVKRQHCLGDNLLPFS